MKYRPNNNDWTQESEFYDEEDYAEYLTDEQVEQILYDRERARDINDYLANG